MSRVVNKTSLFEQSSVEASTLWESSAGDIYLLVEVDEQQWLAVSLSEPNIFWNGICETPAEAVDGLDYFTGTVTISN